MREKILALSLKDQHELVNTMPEYILKHCPELFLKWPHSGFDVSNEYLWKNMPEWIITNRPIWAVKNHPEEVADSYINTMISYDLGWLAKNRTRFMLQNHKAEIIDYLVLEGKK